MCAIYTRKSTEEGLDQDFNSLQAQREAAEAYIKSQKHLGWTLVSKHYDDGGFTGGNLERPALRTLLEDIDAKRVNCVVVYKVDRLSRSLLDFAKLIDRFDHSAVSFVSVTQQFNTTTSLGRLTLNILLSFAQFEREIIGERTRDKMSAARRKGKWTGGMPVLGYDVDPRGGKLVINEAEAVRVREIFRLYERYLSIADLLADLNGKGWTNKSWTTKRDVTRAGAPFQKSTLVRMLTNPLYIGKVTHKGVVYSGEHEALLSPALWEKVNDHIRTGQRGENAVARTPQDAALTGLLFCKSCGSAMKPTYSSKNGRRYRYYFCPLSREQESEGCPTKCIPAGALEESVFDELRLAMKGGEIRRELKMSEVDCQQSFGSDPRTLMQSMVKRVTYESSSGGVVLELGANEN